MGSAAYHMRAVRAEHPPVLISIQPRYVDLILSGRKTVEVRRRRPSFPLGTQLVIYASAPVKRVAATCRLGDVIECDTALAFGRFGEQAAVSEDDLVEYGRGVERMYGLVLADVKLVEPIQLGFHPPQSWMFLQETRSEHRRLLADLALAAGRAKGRGTPPTGQAAS